MDTASKISPFAKVVCLLAIGLSFLLLVGSVALAVYEHMLPKPTWYQHGQTVFVAGSVGTEFVPLPVLEVLPKLFPERFPPTEEDETTGALKGGWIAKYGFLERRGAEEATYPRTESELAGLLKNDELHRRFPVGFTFTNFRPFSPDPSPVTFVGLACAGCHSNRLPDWGPSSKLVYGAGNTRLDLIGFFESFRATLLEKEPKATVTPEQRQDRSLTEGPDLTPQQQQYKLSMTSIKKARIDMGLPALTLAQEAMVCLWLTGAHAAAERTKVRDDLPATLDQLRTPEFNPVGPGRTEPFVTLDHEMFNLPAKHNFGYSKIPAVFRQRYREWAQFDGSVKSPGTRSGLAAMTAGGSVDNLSGLGVARNILAAAKYTVDELVGPRWNDIFPPASPPVTGAGAKVAPTDREGEDLSPGQREGRDVYRKHCARCHGQPDPSDPSQWQTDKVKFSEFGKIVPAINPFGFERSKWPDDWFQFPDENEWRKQTVDPERVVFRDGRRIPFVLYTYFDRAFPQKITGEYFPLRHPLAIDRQHIRNSGGYINAPLDSLFVRAPYLHNASIPTLEQLLNLKDRPAMFLRSPSAYDRDAVGVQAPGPGAAGTSPKPDDAVFWLFDTRSRGNLNTGHNYPWTREEMKANPRFEAQSRALLEYLKTL